VKRRARRCIGVDIGSTSIKVAELSQDRSGVIVQRLIESPLDVAPDTPAETRWAAVVQTLRDMMREHKIGTRQAVFALPGHAVFVRRVRLPRTSEERLERIIRFEARQQIPFPLEQTLLQYQVSATDIEDEVEVLLVAIKRDIVNNYMGLIRRLGLRPNRLGVSSFALFNFHMFDKGIEPEEFTLELTPAAQAKKATAEETVEEKPEGEKPAKPAGFSATLKNLFASTKKAPAEPDKPAEEAPVHEAPSSYAADEVRAYVNIGASTMDLAIGRAGESRIIGFARSIPVAGHQMTRSIQERCGCETFAEAERIKREQTQVLLAGRAIASDRSNEQASRAIMPVIDRMISEIRRSLDFYISQPDGMAVDRLVLSGGQATLPNLAAYMEERLGIPVEVATEIHNPTARMSDRAGGATTNYLIAIGMALHGLGASCIAIDFLPEQLKGWIEFKRKNAYLAAQAALLAAMLFVVSLTGDRMARLWNRQASEMAVGYAAAKPEMDRYTRAQAKRLLVSGLTYALIRGAAVSEAFGLDRNYAFKVLALIQSVRPADVFFEEVDIGPNGELKIDGRAEQYNSAATLVMQLKSRKDMIDKAELMGPPQQIPDTTGRGRLYRFLVNAQIKGKVSEIVPTPTPEGFRGSLWGPARAPAATAAPLGPPRGVGPGGVTPADVGS
jgi:Tfp pilus assembly PilM family ATPase